MKKITSTIAFKLIVPIITIFIIVVSIALIRKINDIKEFTNEKAKLESDNLMQAMKNKVQAAENSALFTSAIYSDFSSVKWAFSIYNKTGDLDSAHSIIKRNVMPTIENIAKNTGVEPRLHFHLPSSKSLFRSWSDEYGDDLKSFRYSVNDISNTHKPIKTIEIGKSGFVIRGISPIFDSKENYLGSVETIFPYSIIFDRIMSDNNKQSYALYINNSNLNPTIEASYSLSKKANYQIVKSSDNYITKLLNDEDFIFEGTTTVKHKITNNCVCAISPIKDYLGNVIGVVAMQIDISDVIATIDKTVYANIVMAAFVVLLVILIIYLGIRWVVINPINKLSLDINEIAKGKLISKSRNNNSGIIAVIYHSFNIMLDRMKTTTNFANEIGEGNLDVELENLSDEDELGQSLVRMKNNLLEANKQETKNKNEEEKRAWATKGFAYFADILRQNTDNIEAFSTQIISNLVKYTNSNQGGLFILNDNDENNIVLELEAVYAYDRKKYAEKEIKLGEGLIGTCAIEKEKILLTDIPDSYLNITSGLGDANPRCVLLVPLKLEDKVFGVIEIASFNIYEDYEIEFIEKLAESIASTLSTAKTNILTQELLEQSQQQAEELAATEEEMRQNLEEMQATQEQLEENNIEIKRRNNEMRAQMSAIDKVALVSKTNPKGVITYVNDLFCEVAGYSREELIGQPHNIVRHPDMTKAAFRNLWETIQAGNVWSGKVKNSTKDGGFYWVDANISPIYDENGNVKEYVAIRYLVTHYINDEETVKLVHTIFPDQVSSNKEVEKGDSSFELIVETKPEVNENGINYDSKLISELKKEHNEISDILIELQRAGIVSNKGMDLLLKSKNLLLVHLEKEDKELYPILRDLAKTDDSLKNTLGIFGSEMEKITEFVLDFYSKYSNLKEINKTEFFKDISHFVVAFKDRISKEELVLYKAYNKSFHI